MKRTAHLVLSVILILALLMNGVIFAEAETGPESPPVLEESIPTPTPTPKAEEPTPALKIEQTLEPTPEATLSPAEDATSEPETTPESTPEPTQEPTMDTLEGLNEVETPEEPDIPNEHDESSIQQLQVILIASFDALDEAILRQEFDFGEITSVDQIALPSMLSGIDADGNRVSIAGIVWHSSPPFDPEVPGVYVFTPALPEGYEAAEGVEVPGVTVYLGLDEIDIMPLADPVCEIVETGVKYISLEDAIADFFEPLTYPDYQTIRLLTDITYTTPLVIPYSL